MRKWIFLVSLFFFTFLHAESSQQPVITQESVVKLETLRQKISGIDELVKDNMWLKRYDNYLTYQKLLDELTTVDAELKKVKATKDRATLEHRERLQSKQESLEKQLELLQEFKNSPFKKLTEPTELEVLPKITNPIAIISALSYMKKIRQDSLDFKARADKLDELIKKLQEKQQLLEEVQSLEPSIINEDLIYGVQKELNSFLATQEIVSTSHSIYAKKVDEATLRVTQDITAQVKRAFNIGIFIVVVIVITLLLKFVAKRYIEDNERFYLANKILNLANITVIVLILLFAYLENVSYLVTFLGFASAGIAIAMKDFFMSILGWMVIVIGGSFHVGDRIKVKKDGLNYVGDIIDISLLRITILEDITLVTYSETRRSGRVVFIPNNYIFTSLISNYTHGTLRTIWDGIDVFITFDSNHKKAMHLIREITKKYAKGYTDIARKQLNLLRNQYSLKNTNVEPRVFCFIEPQGMCISAWYMTNAYGTFALRSTISSEIIDALNKEDDITIAYPTQNINLVTKRKMPTMLDQETKFVDEKSIF